MTHIPAVLFPHSGLSGPELSAALSLLAPLSVCVPWHVEPGEAVPPGVPEEAVRVVRPPEELKPADGFRRMLADYKQWILKHADRSLLSSLKAGVALGDEDDPLWEIRSRIRSARPEPPQGDARAATRWHLVLHLARELEEQRGEADRILNDLRLQRSPLEGVSDELDETRGLFDDLPGFQWGPGAVPAHPAPVVEAWTGLFGGLPGPGALLLTLERSYVDYLAGIWAEACDNPSGPPAVRFRLPDLSGEDAARVFRLRGEHLTEPAAKRLGEILRGFGERPEEDLRALSGEAEGLASWCPRDPARGGIVLTAVRLTGPPGDSEKRARHPLARLWGTTLLSMEKPL